MKETDNDYLVHVFICTNEKKGESCGPHGAEDIRKELKDWAKSKPEWKKKIRINSSGCLDRCKEGVACAIYPQNKWFVHVRRKNLDELKAEIESLMNEALNQSNQINQGETPVENQDLNQNHKQTEPAN